MKEVEHLHDCLRLAHERKRELLHQWFELQKGRETTWDTVTEFLGEQIRLETQDAERRSKLKSALVDALQLHLDQLFPTRETSNSESGLLSASLQYTDRSLSSMSGSPRLQEKPTLPTRRLP